MSDILPEKSGAFFDSGNTGRAIAADAFNLFEFCRYILCGAKINHPKRGDIELKKRINLSKHFKIDLIHSIAAINRDGANFHLLSLIYESLCYKANPKASDKELV